jgi:hypothetical protein
VNRFVYTSDQQAVICNLPHPEPLVKPKTRTFRFDTGKFDTKCKELPPKTPIFQKIFTPCNISAYHRTRRPQPPIFRHNRAVPSNSRRAHRPPRLFSLVGWGSPHHYCQNQPQIHVLTRAMGGTLALTNFRLTTCAATHPPQAVPKWTSDYSMLNNQKPPTNREYYVSMYAHTYIVRPPCTPSLPAVLLAEPTSKNRIVGIAHKHICI